MGSSILKPFILGLALGALAALSFTAAEAATPAGASGDLRSMALPVEGCTLKLVAGPNSVRGRIIVREVTMDGSVGTAIGKPLEKVGDAVTLKDAQQCDLDFVRNLVTGYEMDLAIVPPEGSTCIFHIVSKLTGDKIQVSSPVWMSAAGASLVDTSPGPHCLISISTFGKPSKQR